MPYRHSGEIGDVWKHMPLSDILKIEAPNKYYEATSASAEYKLLKNTQNIYGIYNVYDQTKKYHLENSDYLKILKNIDFSNNDTYLGSPAIAMTILRNSDTCFYFHDIEKDSLDNITSFSEKLKLSDRVTTILGDSISAFMQNKYSFSNSDFVFIDPYQPFDCNDAGISFFDVFIKAYHSNAKTMLWYGYDNLKGKNKIIDKLQTISYEFGRAQIHTFDVWQKCMEQDHCTVNPGVPGCGIAVANLSNASINSIVKYLSIIGNLYRNVYYNGINTSLCTGHLLL